MRITNDTGDIKRGKQGCNAYQLKDGQQMRRVISRKAGIVSKPQNRQRQLFGLALRFKSSLSLEDKRNLESMAYIYHIRNRDGIVFNWSMLAMKFGLARPTITTTKLG